MPVVNVPDDHFRQMIKQRGEDFRDKAPTTAASASSIILDGVREQRWRILGGEDAHVLDRIVREAPEEAYGDKMMAKLNSAGHFGVFQPAADKAE